MLGGLDGRSHGAQPSRVASPQSGRRNRLRILPICTTGNLAGCKLDASHAEGRETGERMFKREKSVYGRKRRVEKEGDSEDE